MTSARQTLLGMWLGLFAAGAVAIAVLTVIVVRAVAAQLIG
jgi:hypothetical protein